MTITVRFLNDADKASWNVLWADYVGAEYSVFSQALLDGIFQRLVEPATENMKALVAEEGGHLLGFVHFIFHPHTWRLDEVCYINDLYTVPAARGKGIATTLVEGVYNIADERESPYVYWMTRETNEGARKLYDKLGDVTPFVRYRRRQYAEMTGEVTRP